MHWCIALWSFMENGFSWSLKSFRNILHTFRWQRLHQACLANFVEWVSRKYGNPWKFDRRELLIFHPTSSRVSCSKELIVVFNSDNWAHTTLSFMVILCLFRHFSWISWMSCMNHACFGVLRLLGRLSYKAEPHEPFADIPRKLYLRSPTKKYLC